MTSTSDAELMYYDIMQKPFEISGFPWIKEEKVYCRLPLESHRIFNENLIYLSWHTAGGKVRFKTNSEVVAIKAVLRGTNDVPTMPRSSVSSFDVYIGSGVNKRFIQTAIPGSGETGIFKVIEGLSGEMKELTFHFPQYNGVEKVEIGVTEGAVLEGPEAYATQKPIIFYGSSITQGASSSRPGNSYTNILSRWLNANIVNLGFSGSAKGEAEMAELIAGMEMSVFVMDYDHNAPDPEHLERTHAPFFQTIRNRHPDLPVIMISRPGYEFGAKVNRIRKEVIHSTYKNAVSAGDQRVFFVDGQTLFGGWDRDSCTVDCSHPNDFGFIRMAEGMLPFVKEALDGILRTL